MKRIKGCILIQTIFVSILVSYISPNAEAGETCEKWVAKVVSVQSRVQVRRVSETEWVPVKLDDTFCSGDMIRVQERSRAAIFLSNETILRLDQKTTITFSGLEKERTFLIDLLRGAVHIFSRIPRRLKVATPFVNGAVEGTEFLVRVERDQTFISVFEGKVAATNEAGSLTLAIGQSAIATAGKAPALHTVVRPRDAVQWALYYPPVLEYRPANFPGGTETGWQGMVRKSIEFYWKDDPAMAFSSLEGAPEDISDSRFFIYRAALLLSVGRVEEANIDLERALSLDPRNSHAFAIQSIIAVVQNKKDKALDLARKAVELNPKASTARVALSYAEQSHFDLQKALESIQEAVKLDSENELVLARLAELWLSVGNLDRALEAAKEAVALNPNVAHTQTVLGFAYLTQIKTENAKNAFRKAIELDQAAPLPRLGLGLAKIREGNLKTGRTEIEIAASLDPNNSLIRSYLGKAYFEEKREKLDRDQFKIAKELDPLDPTPWFYDAIRKQTVNRPVEALQDLQKSIELNDNRAVYRSRLLLDEDLAARSASLARIYSDLGFQQLALVEGWKSVNIDPSNYSAHRFLADSYSVLPRHEIARVSELLQSQLLQPINITPVQPALAESNLLILEGAGPADPSFNEFNPLFNQNRFALQASGVVGGNNMLGDEVVFSGLWGRFSYSLGQFHYETDGFRDNNDLEEDIYNVFAQVSLSHKTSIQAEYRYKESNGGDLPLFFDPDNFISNLRSDIQSNTLRFGLHHTIAPHSDVIASVIYRNIDDDLSTLPEFDSELDEDGYMAEVQYIFSSEILKITGGAGYFSSDLEDVSTFTPSDTTKIEIATDHINLYVYSQINYPETVTWTIGASADFLDSNVDQDQFNPKVGLTWNPFLGTTFRAAIFRTLKRKLISDQTIEPTQLAGFNQFFDDGDDTDAWRYGIGIDQKLSDQAYAGAEFSKRDLEVPGDTFDPVTFDVITKEFDVDEELGRAYVFWTPHNWLALSAEYQYEHFGTPVEFMINDVSELDTHRFIFGINFFHPSGFYAKLRPSYISQDGKFAASNPFDPFATSKGEDDFWYVDASIGYRLPKRYGKVTVEARNLFDENFRFQDTDPSNPTIYPERLILVKFTLAL